MLDKKRVIRAAGAFSGALAIGFIMQGGPSGLFGSGGAQHSQLGTVAMLDNMPVSEISHTAALQTPNPIETAMIAPVEEAVFEKEELFRPPSQAHESDQPAQSDEIDLSADCTATMRATSMTAAMVELHLDAPCQVNERVTIHHNGMMFTETTDQSGTLRTLAPALAEQSVFIAAFSSGDGAVATVSVPGIKDFDRVVVQWKGQSGLQIHALEYAAGYGDRGHVWAESSKGVDAAMMGEGGFLTRHGAEDIADALLAEVYSFPTANAVESGDVQLSVEAEVTELNCGRDVEAQTIQFSPGSDLRVQNLNLPMPACDALGDFLVLKNLLNDLKIAGN